ncbi:MAG: hypothetical protein WC565_07795 [Parcubacteria group bacterium]|jgi:hypothetical protein|nr:hypothetical protein [Candidatus Krumholzibacteria bacterium]
MEYRFNDGERYFSAAVQKTIDDFIESSLWVGDNCKNASGETRLIEEVRLPYGAVVSGPTVSKGRETVYSTMKGRRGERLYHTPYANLEGATEPQIMYKDESGSLHTTGWAEFKKWLGSKFELIAKPPDPVNPQQEARRKMIFNQKMKQKELEDSAAELEKVKEIKDSLAGKKPADDKKK